MRGQGAMADAIGAATGEWNATASRRRHAHKATRALQSPIPRLETWREGGSDTRLSARVAPSRQLRPSRVATSRRSPPRGTQQQPAAPRRRGKQSQAAFPARYIRPVAWARRGWGGESWREEGGSLDRNVIRPAGRRSEGLRRLKEPNDTAPCRKGQVRDPMLLLYKQGVEAPYVAGAGKSALA